MSGTLEKKMGGWLRIAGAAAYMDVSVRTVRRLLKIGLPHVRIPTTRTVLIKLDQLDDWLISGGFPVDADEVDEIAEGILKRL